MKNLKSWYLHLCLLCCYESSSCLALQNIAASSVKKRPLGPSRLGVAVRSSTDSVADSRCYAPVRAFCADVKGECDVMVRLDEVINEDKQLNRKTFDWYSSFYRIGIVIFGYVFYPIVALMLSILPEETGLSQSGNYFFALVSIVFGTLTAATVSDASSRLALLRSIAVDEVTLMLPLVKRIQIEADILRERGMQTRIDGQTSPDDPKKTMAYLGDSDRTGYTSNDMASFFDDSFRLLWGHTSMLISGSRVQELQSIANGQDYLLRFIELLHRSQSDDRFDVPKRDFTFAMNTAEKIVELRGRRLSLENAGISDLQLGALKTISVSLLAVFCYLSLDRTIFDLYHVDEAPLLAAFALDSAFGERLLFAYLVGALALLNNLTSDLNRPFNGELTMESATLVATLVQERRTMASHLDISIDSGLGAV